MTTPVISPTSPCPQRCYGKILPNENEHEVIERILNLKLFDPTKLEGIVAFGPFWVIDEITTDETLRKKDFHTQMHLTTYCLKTSELALKAEIDLIKKLADMLKIDHSKQVGLRIRHEKDVLTKLCQIHDKNYRAYYKCNTTVYDPKWLFSKTDPESYFDFNLLLGQTQKTDQTKEVLPLNRP